MANGRRPAPWTRWLMLLLIGVVAWRVLSLGLADIQAVGSPEQALRWRAGHPEALFRAAEKLVEAGSNPDRATKLAQTALVANLRDGRPLRLLGQLAQARGDLASAHRYYSLALRRSPRDLPSRGWMFEHELRAGRITTALAHADLLLRLQPELADRILPLLLALADEPGATPALSQLLATSPPWRLRFLVLLFKQPQGRVPPQALLADAAISQAGLSPEEWFAWLEHLAARGEWGVAYAYWAGRQPTGTVLANVHNGGFEMAPDGGSFDWRFDHVAGASIERLHEPGVIGRLALSVGFDRQRVPFRHVRQRLLLAPGRHRLEGLQRADALETSQGLSWTIACADSGQLLGRTENLNGSGPWAPFALDFEVPEACDGQWLELSLLARTASEQWVSGRAWFDEMKVVRQ